MGLRDCIGGELDFTLTKLGAGTVETQKGVTEDQAKLIDVSAENDCGTTFELNVTYKVQDLDGNFEGSFKKDVARTSTIVETSLKVDGSEIVVKKDVCLKGLT